MRTRLIPARWETILEFVKARNGAAVGEIAAALVVSEATVRRDLARIDQRGLIRRTRGGAAPTPDAAVGQTLARSQQINAREKESIGCAAARLVKPGSTVMFDGGSTSLQVARRVNACPLTVVTTSVDIACELGGRPQIRMIMVGGELDLETGTTTGPRAVEQLLDMSADMAILGADALCPQQGISSPSALTAQNKKAMVLRCRNIVMVADHTKLGKLALYHVGDPKKIRTLVTDALAPADLVEQFRAAGVDVIVAGKP